MQSKVVKFAKVLDTTVSYLMGWDEIIEENPVETANKLADMFLDEDLMAMIDEYQKLDARKQEQVREYVHFLLERG